MDRIDQLLRHVLITNNVLKRYIFDRVELINAQNGSETTIKFKNISIKTLFEQNYSLSLFKDVVGQLPDDMKTQLLSNLANNIFKSYHNANNHIPSHYVFKNIDTMNYLLENYNQNHNESNYSEAIYTYIKDKHDDYKAVSGDKDRLPILRWVFNSFDLIDEVFIKIVAIDYECYDIKFLTLTVQYMDSHKPHLLVGRNLTHLVILGAKERSFEIVWILLKYINYRKVLFQYIYYILDIELFKKIMDEYGSFGEQYNSPNKLLANILESSTLNDEQKIKYVKHLLNDNRLDLNCQAKSLSNQSWELYYSLCNILPKTQKYSADLLYKAVLKEDMGLVMELIQTDKIDCDLQVNLIHFNHEHQYFYKQKDFVKELLVKFRILDIPKELMIVLTGMQDTDDGIFQSWLWVASIIHQWSDIIEFLGEKYHHNQIPVKAIYAAIHRNNLEFIRQYLPLIPEYEFDQDNGFIVECNNSLKFMVDLQAIKVNDLYTMAAKTSNSTLFKQLLEAFGKSTEQKALLWNSYFNGTNYISYTYDIISHGLEIGAVDDEFLQKYYKEILGFNLNQVESILFHPNSHLSPTTINKYLDRIVPRMAMIRLYFKDYSLQRQLLDFYIKLLNLLLPSSPTPESFLKIQSIVKISKFLEISCQGDEFILGTQFYMEKVKMIGYENEYVYLIIPKIFKVAIENSSINTIYYLFDQIISSNHIKLLSSISNIIKEYVQGYPALKYLPISTTTIKILIDLNNSLNKE